MEDEVMSSYAGLWSFYILVAVSLIVEATQAMSGEHSEN
jgi:hypothetical protein